MLSRNSLLKKKRKKKKSVEKKKNLGGTRKGNRVANNLLVGAACLFCVKITLYGNLYGKSKSAV